MPKRQAVDQPRDIVAVGPLPFVRGVLGDHLQTVLMDFVFAEQIDILVLPTLVCIN
jgi:hypothetical protein